MTLIEHKDSAQWFSQNTVAIQLDRFSIYNLPIPAQIADSNKIK